MTYVYIFTCISFRFLEYQATQYAELADKHGDIKQKQDLVDTFRQANNTHTHTLILQGSVACCSVGKCTTLHSQGMSR